MGRAGAALVARQQDVPQEARKLASLFDSRRTPACRNACLRASEHASGTSPRQGRCRPANDWRNAELSSAASALCPGGSVRAAATARVSGGDAVSRPGIVVIGRNEGERLRRCLRSLSPSRAPFVYVDSGSTDGSPEWAAAAGAEVVALDPESPFTAARARNAGVDRLLRLDPTVEYVQFVDGDCEIAAGWLDAAQRELERDARLAVVCGRRRERFPERSIYHRLCELEWDTPIGEAAFCGGDAMIRMQAFRAVGGFNPDLIAGEEPDFCVRLRQRGFLVGRIDHEMTLHDAAMTRLSQWWRRAVRSGHAYAEGAALHGASPERHWRRARRSIIFWGVWVPLTALILCWPTRGLSLTLVAAYPVLAARIYTRSRAGGLPVRDARLYAAFCVLAKFPQAVGQLEYLASRMLRRRRQLIEYKRPSPTWSDL